MLDVNQRINGVRYIVKKDRVEKIYDIGSIDITSVLRNLREQMESAISTHILASVKSVGYDNENSIAKYLVPGNPFYEECSKISIWIGNVWKKANEIEAQAKALGNLSLTVSDVLSQLPKFPIKVKG